MAEQYDVIGNEESVPKALTLGIPLFLANEGYVEGYLTDENMARHEAEHFCALTLRNCPDADEWVDLLKMAMPMHAHGRRRNAPILLLNGIWTAHWRRFSPNLWWKNTHAGCTIPLHPQLPQQSGTGAANDVLL